MKSKYVGNPWIVVLNAALAVWILVSTTTAFAQEQEDPYVQSRTVLRPVSKTAEVATLRYTSRDQTALPVDIYFDPSSATARPAIVLISGADDARSWGGFQDFARLAVERGFVGIVAAKRFPRGGAGIQTGSEDTRALLTQLATLMPKKIDTSRVCVWAFSAGGTLLSVAYGPDAPKLSCAIGFYPAVSIAAQASAEWKETYSPSDVVAKHGSERSPPTLIVRAGRDSEMLNSGIARFVDSALARNVPVSVVNLPAAQHGFDWHDDFDWSRAAIEDAFAFARRHTAGASSLTAAGAKEAKRSQENASSVVK